MCPPETSRPLQWSERKLHLKILVLSSQEGATKCSDLFSVAWGGVTVLSCSNYNHTIIQSRAEHSNCRKRSEQDGVRGVDGRTRRERLSGGQERKEKEKEKIRRKAYQEKGGKGRCRITAFWGL